MQSSEVSTSQLPPVDVVILSWNRVEDTMSAIASAADQVGVDQRILVVDQGSESENVARLEQFLESVPCARLQKLPANSGVPGGRNIGAAMGNAPYIVALDSDAVFAEPDALLRAVSYLDANPNLCAIGFRILNYYTGGTDWSSWDYPRACNPERPFAATRFVGAGHAMRRSTFEAVGTYDPSLVFCGEELDLCYRMINTGLRIEYMPEVAILHKVSPEHRVFWGAGRFFQTVRNNLYTLYKLNTPPLRLMLAALAFLMRGVRNGVATQALRGMLACLPMCRTFRRTSRHKQAYRLTADTWRYIHACEPGRRDRLLVKLRRQFVALPFQG
jgi:GT2 family glycosyltransferase